MLFCCVSSVFLCSGVLKVLCFHVLVHILFQGCFLCSSSSDVFCCVCFTVILVFAVWHIFCLFQCINHNGAKRKCPVCCDAFVHCFCFPMCFVFHCDPCVFLMFLFFLWLPVFLMSFLYFQCSLLSVFCSLVPSLSPPCTQKHRLGVQKSYVKIAHA